MRIVRLSFLLALCLGQLPAFSQKKLEPTEDKVHLIVRLVDGSERPVPKAPLRLSSPDGELQYSGQTDKGGSWELLVPRGTAYFIQVGDSLRYDVLKVPDAPRITTRKTIHFQGSINGKAILPDLRSFNMRVINPVYTTEMKLRFINRKMQPLPDEEISLVGIDTLHRFTAVTDEDGWVSFRVPMGEIYRLGMKYNARIDELPVPKMSGPTEIKGTYGVHSSADIEAQIEAIRLSADTLVDDTRLSKLALKRFGELARRTGGKLYIKGKEDQASELIGALLGEQVESGTDLLLLIDVSGSMSDDLEDLQTNTQVLLESLRGTPDLRVAVGGYSDERADGEGWLKLSDFSEDLESIKAGLLDLKLLGGGDWPESVYDGVAGSLSDLDWREDSQGGRKRMILILGDAPPLEGEFSRHQEDDIVRICTEAGISTNLYPVLIGY